LQKSETEVRKSRYGAVREMPMYELYVLLSGNDTVPSSIWCGGAVPF